MNFNLLALRSALKEHKGTIYYVNPKEIASFYDSVENNDKIDGDSTVIYMTDGKTYNVKEAAAELSGCFGEIWTH